MDKVVIDVSAPLIPTPEEMQRMRLQLLRTFESGKIDAGVLQSNLERLQAMEEGRLLSEPQVVEMTPEEVTQQQKDQAEGVQNRRRQRREMRNGLLRSSDWTQISDAPLTSEKKEEWRVYRQALRDFDVTTENQWPQPPV